MFGKRTGQPGTIATAPRPAPAAAPVAQPAPGIQVEAFAFGGEPDSDQAQAAARKPHSCPPPKGQVRMGGPELLAEFQKIPAAQRNVSVKTAFYAIMQRRYPCSG